MQYKIIQILQRLWDILLGDIRMYIDLMVVLTS